MFERRPGAACFLVRPISEAAAIEAMIELLANRATTTPCASPTAAPHRERGQGRRGDPVSGRKGEQDAGEVAARDGANRLPDSVTSARPAAATPTGEAAKRIAMRLLLDMKFGTNSEAAAAMEKERLSAAAR